MDSRRRLPLIDGAFGGEFPILVHDTASEPDQGAGGHENSGQEQEDLPFVAVDAHLAQLPGFFH